MQLIKLSANKESFHTVKFNRGGLSFIIGRKSQKSGSSIKDSYNGVGKSLVIELIHFCLASDSNDEFKDKLPGWEFSLEFEISGNNFVSSRNTENQGVIILNGEEYSLTELRNKLGKDIFYLDPQIPGLAFRGLFSHFARRYLADYVKYTGNIYNQYRNLLEISYLMGLDIDKCIRKYDYKTQIKKLKDSKKELKRNDIVKEHFGNDPKIDLANLETQIENLELSIKNTKVAEDYHDIQCEADAAANQLDLLTNDEFTYANAINNIKNSLQIKPDIDAGEVINLYQSAKVEINSLIKKRLEDVVNFHHSLLTSRIARLKKEKQKFEKLLKELNIQRARLSVEQDRLTRYLSEHGALEKYTALNIKLSDLKEKFNKLNTFRELLSSYDIKESLLKRDLDNEEIETDEYLESDAGKNLTSEIHETFRSFSKEFYRDRPGGISIDNNKGFNQQRFKVEVSLEDDTSDGVNEVKIFCFDYALLTLAHNHNIKLLIHDSRLFGEMDPRQAATAFRLAHETINRRNLQYIVSINEDRIDAIKNALYEETGNDDLFDQIFNDKSIVLELTDESDQTKLLGIKVNLKYDKNR